MIALLVVLVGLAVVVGAKGLAHKLAHLAGALLVAWLILDALLHALPRSGLSIGQVPAVAGWPLGVVLTLVALGALLWHRRGHAGQGPDSRSRLHGRPRQRALPPPPQTDAT